MAKPRKITAKSDAGKRVKPATRRARIRMYRVGLGDCFLLTFYAQREPQNVLIDCGMFSGSRLDTTQKERDVQLAVVNSIVNDTKGKLNAVVITHEHMDHVSIFNSARTLFEEKLTFDQAWFGWVEDPKNKEAQKLREKYEGLKTALSTALARLQALASSNPGEYQDLHFGVAGVAEFTGLASDGTSIAQQPRAAMDFVKTKAGKGNLRFGSPGDIWEFAGLKVYVLGPPTAEKQMRVMERAGASYDRALATANAADGNPESWDPFTEQWRLRAGLEDGIVRLATEPNNAGLEDIVARYNDAREAWRRIDNLALDSASNLALQMDKYINNTSLALAFEFPNGDVMLFPGDAQVGSWDSWFEIQQFDVNDLLRRTIFYKVGHHGSHNATLKSALERMTNPKLVAMIPTNESFARDSKHWTMPAPNLNHALKDHTQNRLLRNDQGFNNVPDPLTTADWDGLERFVTVNSLYIDYYV